MLIDVTKNETTGKYEVETDVKPTPAPGGGAIAYAWNFEHDFGGTGIAYFNFDVAPEDEMEFETKRDIVPSDSSSPYIAIYPCDSNYGYSKQSNTQFYIRAGKGGTTYTRADSSEDIDIWIYEPGGGGGEEIGPGLVEKG